MRSLLIGGEAEESAVEPACCRAWLTMALVDLPDLRPKNFSGMPDPLDRGYPEKDFGRSGGH